MCDQTLCLHVTLWHKPQTVLKQFNYSVWKRSIYLNVWDIERERGRDMGRASICWFTPPSDHSSQGCSGIKAVTWKPVEASRAWRPLFCLNVTEAGLRSFRVHLPEPTRLIFTWLLLMTQSWMRLFSSFICKCTTPISQSIITEKAIEMIQTGFTHSVLWFTRNSYWSSFFLQKNLILFEFEANEDL